MTAVRPVIEDRIVHAYRMALKAHGWRIEYRWGHWLWRDPHTGGWLHERHAFQILQAGEAGKAPERMERIEDIEEVEVSNG